jgi:cation:H+ antiporter
LEAENVAVGLIAGHNGQAEIALGTAYGGATFIVCTALGLGALIAPLRVNLPKAVIALPVVAAVIAGIPLIGSTTPRWSGAMLLCAFAVAIAYVVHRSRTHRFVESDELREALERPRPLWLSSLLAIAGIAVITGGGELVAQGAAGIVAAFGVPALLVGMVITPAAIEAEEIARQVVSTRRGYPDVAAGNVIGTVLYFLFFNLGLITLITPVAVPRLVRLVDWPFLVAVSLIATILLARGRVGRLSGLALVGLGMAYAAIHVVVR